MGRSYASSLPSFLLDMLWNKEEESLLRSRTHPMFHVSRSGGCVIEVLDTHTLDVDGQLARYY